jgi:hypothetical protein
MEQILKIRFRLYVIEPLHSNDDKITKILKKTSLKGGRTPVMSLRVRNEVKGADSFVGLTVLSFCWKKIKRQLIGGNIYVSCTPACVKTCNSQDTMSAKWRKERSTVETNEIMKTAAHRSESWCWRQLLSLLSHVLMIVLKAVGVRLPLHRLFFRKVAYTRFDVTGFMEQMGFESAKGFSQAVTIRIYRTARFVSPR